MIIVSLDQKNTISEKNLILQIYIQKICIIYLIFLLLFIYHIHLNFFISIFKFNFAICIIVEPISSFPTITFILTYFLNIDFVLIPFYGYYVVSILVLYQVSIFIFYLKTFICALNSDSVIYTSINV